MPLNVETLGYYQRDNDMNIVLDALPRTINENRKYFENPSQNPFPPTQWLLVEPDRNGGEDFLDSLLEYIRLKGWPERNKPHFVTNRQLLKAVASRDHDSSSYVQAFRHDGVIFVLYIQDDYKSSKQPFVDFFTTPRNDENVSSKAVFMTELSSSQKIMYSAELDAILDEENKEHCHIRVSFDGLNDHFLRNRSEGVFWQCLLSNIATLLIGSRYGPERLLNKVKRANNESSTLSVSGVTKYNPLDLPRVSGGWNVSDGEQRLELFFSLVGKHLRYDGASANFTYNTAYNYWEVSQDKQEIEPFANLVKTKLKELTSETSWMEQYLLMSLQPRR